MSKTPTTPKTSAPATEAAPIWVSFDRPGIAAIGPYKPGVAYRVDAAEAERLIKTKGFAVCDPPADPTTTTDSEAR